MSGDDLGYLCTWGGLGLPLMPWEGLVFADTVESAEASIIDHVEYWVDLQTEHISINGVRWRRGLPPISEEELYLLHKHVCEMRWTRRAALAKIVCGFRL